MRNIALALVLIGLTLQTNFLVSQRSDSTLFVHAYVTENDSLCYIQWTPNYWDWWMTYDDGEAEDFWVWQNPGSTNAVKFHPFVYPVAVCGGEVFVGDSTFPGPFLGTTFQMAVFDDDGENGLPRTILDSMTVTVENYGWVDFTFAGPLPMIWDGSFYLGMIQTAAAPNTAPIGVDTDNPVYNLSYSKFTDHVWLLSPFQDFMIRAWITNQLVPPPAADEFEVTRFHYTISGGQYITIDTLILDTTEMYSFLDEGWSGLPAGWYGYGIKSHYPGGEWSDYYYSEVLPHLMVTTGDLPENATTPEIYPNPCNGTLYVRSFQNITHINLINFQGKEIPVRFADDDYFILDLNHLPDGVYILQLQIEREIFSEKIILLK
jgi:hypothetical protein